MKRLPALIGLALTIITSTLPAQSPARVVRESSLGSVWYRASNYGLFGSSFDSTTSGYDSTLVGFEYPRGSRHNYIFGSGLVFGCRKMVEGAPAPAVFMTYNPNSGYCWAAPGEHDNPALAGPLYGSTDYDRQTGTYIGPSVPPNPEPWPLWRAPARKVTPMNAGTFEPADSNRNLNNSRYRGPAFMPGVDEEFVARFNDGDTGLYRGTSARERKVFPIGLQMQQITCGWASGPFQSVVLLQYRIENVSGTTLSDCIAAMAIDPDLGSPYNDHGRYYTERPDLRTCYFWSEGERSIATPYEALAATVVEAPVVDSTGFVDNSRRSAYLADGRIGTFELDPNEDEPFTNAGQYRLVTSGHLHNDSESIPGGDLLTYICSTPFAMHAGDVAYFTIAYTVVAHVPEMEAKGPGRAPELEGIIEPLMRAYYASDGFAGTISVPDPAAGPEAVALTAAPNPATLNTSLCLALSQPATVTIELADIMGQRVMVRDLGYRPAGSYREPIDLSGLAAGLYIATANAGGAISVVRLIVTK